MFSRTKQWEEWHFFAVLEISFMSDLMKDSWILTYASAFSLLHHHMACILWKIPLHPHKTMKGKRENDTLFSPTLSRYMTYTTV